MVDQTDLDAVERGGARRHAARVGRDADQPDAEGRRHPGRGRALAAARSSRSTTRSRRRSTSGRWSSAPTPSVHSTTKYLGGHSDAVGGAVVVTDADAPRGGALRAELDRRRARAAGLLPHAPRAAHAAPADGGAHRERARRRRRGCEGVEGVYDVRWPGISGMVSFRHPDAVGIVSRDEAVLAGGVARRRGVADRGPAGDDAPVRRGLRRGGAGRPRAALVRDRGGRGSRRGPRPGASGLKSCARSRRCGGRWESLRPSQRERAAS